MRKAGLQIDRTWVQAYGGNYDRLAKAKKGALIYKCVGGDLETGTLGVLVDEVRSKIAIMLNFGMVGPAVIWDKKSNWKSTNKKFDGQIDHLIAEQGIEQGATSIMDVEDDLEGRFKNAKGVTGVFHEPDRFRIVVRTQPKRPGGYANPHQVVVKEDNGGKFDIMLHSFGEVSHVSADAESLPMVVDKAIKVVLMAKKRKASEKGFNEMDQIKVAGELVRLAKELVAGGSSKVKSILRKIQPVLNEIGGDDNLDLKLSDYFKRIVAFLESMERGEKTSEYVGNEIAPIRRTIDSEIKSAEKWLKGREPEQNWRGALGDDFDESEFRDWVRDMGRGLSSLKRLVKSFHSEVDKVL